MLSIEKQLLDLLRCPYCGMHMQFARDATLRIENHKICSGVLYCYCCSYPVLDGIPYMRADSTSRRVIDLLVKGDLHEARLALLGLSGAARDNFESLRDSANSFTFRQALEILCPNAEGTYLLYRFSDPTFLVGQAVVRSFVQDDRCVSKRILDLCGGAGHLTRLISSVADGSNVVLADIAYWKLWLAKNFVAPQCQPICCDATLPLPFAKDDFSFAVCADAFHYIWPKRLLAGELMRLVGDSGVIVLPHLHNALCENCSAGMPLPPLAYRSLFEGKSTKLFGETKILTSLLANTPFDWSSEASADELSQEPALMMLVTALIDLRLPERLGRSRISGSLRINPLYKLDNSAGSGRLRLNFPSEFYESEYALCKSYLPATVELNGMKDGCIDVDHPDTDIHELMDRYVLLDLPDNYL